MGLCWQSNVLLFNMLSRLVITFLPRSKCLLISWLQSPYAVILELPKIKSLTVAIVSPSICHEVMGPEAMIFVFWMLSFKPTRNTFTSSFSIWMSFISFSCLIFLARTPVQCWIEVSWGEILVLFLILGGKHFFFFHWDEVSVGFFVCSL